MAGYQQERFDRTDKGGSILVYIRDSIKYKPRLDIPENVLELICVEIEPLRSNSFLLLVFYRPPNDPIDSFNKLENVLFYLDKEGKEIILLGDTNCDITRSKADQPSNGNQKHICSIFDLFIFKKLIEVNNTMFP